MARKQRRIMQPRQSTSAPATAPITTPPLATTGERVDDVTRYVGGASDAWGLGGGADNLARFLPKCHHNPTHMIEIDSVPISVCDGYGARRAKPGSVVLNCTGDPRHDNAVIPDSMSALRAHLEKPPVTEITLPWPDGGLPPVEPSFWRALIEACAAASAPLVIHCIGGHGRTGTALAAILVAYSIPAEDAIAFVREHHCTKAIETAFQEEYLEELDAILNPPDSAWL